MRSGLAIAGRLEPARRRDPVLGFVSDAVTRQTLEHVLEELHLPSGLVVEGGVAAALRVLGPDAAPRILVIDISGSDAPVADVAALAAAGAKGMRIITLGTTNDVALYRDLRAAGAADYLIKPVGRHQLQAALLDSDGHQAAEATTGASHAAKTLVFIGSRGGVGTTTCALNAAWILAQELGHRVGLVDFDLQFGTVALALDLEPGRGLREALERPSRIDSLFIERAMERLSERLFVLGAEEPLQDEFACDPTAPDILLHELKQKFDWVVVDLPRGAALIQRQVMSSATHIAIVCDLSLAGMRDAIRLQAMAQESAPDAMILFLSGGVDGARKSGVSPADFERSVGQRLDGVLPFDAAAAAAAALAGKPMAQVAKKSRAVAVLRHRLRDLAVDAGAGAAKGRRRWFAKG